MLPKPTAPNPAPRVPAPARRPPSPLRIRRSAHEGSGAFGAREERVRLEEPGLHVDDDADVESRFDFVAESRGRGVAGEVPGEVVAIVGELVCEEALARRGLEEEGRTLAPA